MCYCQDMYVIYLMWLNSRVLAGKLSCFEFFDSFLFLYLYLLICWHSHKLIVLIIIVALETSDNCIYIIIIIYQSLSLIYAKLYIYIYVCVLKCEDLEATKRMGMLSWTRLPCICLVVPRRPDYINLLLMSGPDQR